MKPECQLDFVDTTLRDGEQTAGIVFSPEEKIEIVRLLDKVGIKWIEAGVPAMGEEEQELLQSLNNLKTKAKLISWNRMDRNDVLKAVNCGFSYIHVSIPVSDIHIKYKFRQDSEWVINKVSEIVGYAKSFGVEVFIGAEDAARADRDFFLRVAETAANAGASRIRYADTIGCLEPFSVKAEMEYISARCPLPIEFHGHNDFGLAAANSLAAYRGGASFISATSTGIGERAGNACLEEIIVVAERIYNCHFDLHTEYLKELKKFVEKATGRKVYQYKPIIGEAIPVGGRGLIDLSK